jgi:hypothetical protein
VSVAARRFRERTVATRSGQSSSATPADRGAHTASGSLVRDCDGFRRNRYLGQERRRFRRRPVAARPARHESVFVQIRDDASCTVPADRSRSAARALSSVGGWRRTRRLGGTDRDEHPLSRTLSQVAGRPSNRSPASAALRSDRWPWSSPRKADTVLRCRVAEEVLLVLLGRPVADRRVQPLPIVPDEPLEYSSPCLFFG